MPPFGPLIVDEEIAYMNVVPAQPGSDLRRNDTFDLSEFGFEGLWTAYFQFSNPDDMIRCDYLTFVYAIRVRIEVLAGIKERKVEAVFRREGDELVEI